MTLHADSNIAIVGGGIAGLFAARYLLHLGYTNITIIEREKKLGGLLKGSFFKDTVNGHGTLEFDAGTHFILKTGNRSLDKILSLDLPRDEFVEFRNSLHEGQYANGMLYPESGCVNVLHYSSQFVKQITKEMAALPSVAKSQAKNLGDVLSAKYGETARTEILNSIFKKLTGISPDKLDKSVEHTFLPARLILGNRQEMIELKKSPEWNDRVAFASHKDSTSDIVKHYPKSGTTQKWIDQLVNTLQTNGVRLLTDKQVTSIKSARGNVEALHCADGQTVECDFLFWTIAPIFLSHLSGIKVPIKKPSMRSVSIMHFITDKRPLAGPFWVNVYDATLATYRVTLYDNFSPMQTNAGHRVTAEILHSGGNLNSEISSQSIFQELIDMQLLDEDAKCLWSAEEQIPQGFPIMEPGDPELYAAQVNTLSSSFKNLNLVSRFKNGHSGQMAMLENVFSAINALSDEQRLSA